MERNSSAAVPRIYLTDTKVTEAVLASLAATLPPERASRASRLCSTEACVQSVLGFCLVRHALYAATGRVFDADWQEGDDGKPYLSGAPHFNLSHTAHAVAVAIFKDEVGIDIEEVREHHPRLAARICSDTELSLLHRSPDPAHELIRIWSAKEAEGKRLGTGLKTPKNLSLTNVASARLDIGGVPHVLSLSPAAEIPPIAWVTPEQLLFIGR